MKNIVRTKLNRNGFCYTKVTQGLNALLWEQKLIDKIVGYEVHKLSFWKEKVFHDRIIKPYNKWPNKEDFGKKAWAFYSMDKALEKYKAIEANLKSSQPSRIGLLANHI